MCCETSEVEVAFYNDTKRVTDWSPVKDPAKLDIYTTIDGYAFRVNGTETPICDIRSRAVYPGDLISVVTR